MPDPPAVPAPLPALAPAQRRRGIAVLLANSALMTAGFFLLIPLLSVHLTQDLGFSGAAAGAVLAVRQVTQQGLMLFGGALADRAGYRRVIVAGLLVRAIGFFGFALGDAPGVIIGAAVVAALGGALFEATGKAALASLAPPAGRPRLFSLSALAAGAGTTLGPLLGILLLPFGFAWIGVVAGTCFVLAFLVSAVLLPPLSGGAVAGPGGALPGFGQTLRRVARHRTFLVFTALMTGYWLLHNQVYIAVPLRAVQVVGGAGVVGVLYAVNAAAGLALQVPVVRLSARWLSPPGAVALGVAVMGAGLGLMGLAGAPETELGAVAVMAASMVVFAAGRALVEPMKDVVTAELAPPDALGVFFGVSFLALAVGGSVGNYLGGWLFDVATASGRYVLPWIAFALAGLAVGAGMLRFARATGGAGRPAAARAAAPVAG